MFADDLRLLGEIRDRLAPLPLPVVEVGGLETPTVADYQITIDAIENIVRSAFAHAPTATSFSLPRGRAVMDAQYARYLSASRPLAFLDQGYIIENPETGGIAVEDLASKYPGTIGTAVLLSVLEHVANPFVASAALADAVMPGGLVIVSVPFSFPYHPSPRDYWRFSPDGLRQVFGSPAWEILECDWRLNIRADEGVCDPKTMEPHAIRSCYLAARRTAE